MKRRLFQILVVGALLSLLCIAASAAEAPTQSGIYNVKTNVSGLVVTPNGTASSARIDDADFGDFYAGAEYLTVSYTTQDTAQYLIIASAGDLVPPTESNIVYIDQGGSANFKVYPSRLKSGNYKIYITSSGNDENLGVGTPVASFSYYEYIPYTLGDVNGDENIEVGDAVLVLQHVVETIVLTGDRFLAADVTRDGALEVGDAVKILQYVVEAIDRF